MGVVEETWGCRGDMGVVEEARGCRGGMGVVEEVGNSKSKNTENITIHLTY